MAEAASDSSRSTAGGPKSAPALFNRPDADVILSSSDNTNFRVYRQILTLASPFFETMFSLPQSTTSYSSPPPIIPVEEDARTLEDLLRICYPVRDPQLQIHVLTDWQHISNVTHAALKYDMVQAVDFMKAKLTAGVESSPLPVFCVACKHGFEGVAHAVASKLVAQNAPLSIGDLRGVYVSQLEDIPTGCYYRLMHASNTYSVDHLEFCRQRDAKQDLKAQQESDVVYRVPDAATDNLGQHTLRSVDAVCFSVSQETFAVFQSQDPTALGADDDTEQSCRSDSTILSLPEDSRTLELLLQLETQDMNDHATVASCLRASAKYSTKRAHPALAKRWLELSVESPLRSYLIASAYGLKDEAIEAARRLLSWTSQDLRRAYDPVMEDVSAGHYFRLLQYHDKCAAAADGAVRKSWARAFVGDVPRHCPGGLCSRTLTNATASRWADTCLARFKALRDRPRKAVSDDAILIGELCIQVGSCSSCVECVSHIDIVRLLAAFTEANEEVITAVCTL
ncbi:hypothetical protein EVJ58_g7634 [Rhodofomes roseus]|uniref:BTB domain-containing protein n=1 Tax=Rhodofomes roseus TaxID=34475 RepID=A0A4Y9Y2H0_9APHY|nr:hypothetical protein EVJ58_g7634 [Rhodofomes roseus]